MIGYRVTQPTTPVWQTASMRSSLTNCGVYKLRSPTTCLRQPLVFQWYSVPCSACITVLSVRVHSCVTPGEVAHLIQLAPYKTSPHDITPTPLMKLCKDEISVVICHLANISFTSGHFPTSMRTGLVTPLLKKTGLDVDDYKNYRPVTNLSTFCKILERLALVRLKPHITSSPNYCPLQSAYRQLHSTETAVVKIVDDVLAAMDRGHTVTVVGLDMSAAFVAVCHYTIIGRQHHWYLSAVDCTLLVCKLFCNKRQLHAIHPSLLQPTLAFHKDLYWARAVHRVRGAGRQTDQSHGN